VVVVVEKGEWRKEEVSEGVTVAVAAWGSSVDDGAVLPWPPHRG